MKCTVSCNGRRVTYSSRIAFRQASVRSASVVRAWIRPRANSQRYKEFLRKSTHDVVSNSLGFREHRSRNPLPLKCSHNTDTYSPYGKSNKNWLKREAARLQETEPLPGDGLLLTRGSWEWVEASESRYRLQGTLEYHNITAKSEIFVTEVACTAVLLAPRGLHGLQCSVQEHGMGSFTVHPLLLQSLRPASLRPASPELWLAKCSTADNVW
ncbi:hypothetical protein CYMTET_5090 [Cymbomonas tetramitiformis]|uniref:Uncharacterized protein n=1 Tax=Cymbomonas tetramitiformis TaxID=36881 RepID=A0AAE0GZU4_9CHLO|nr:hypothetical protein CYMTET_5090 [Cymbomonas tetramitiformis]